MFRGLIVLVFFLLAGTTSTWSQQLVKPFNLPDINGKAVSIKTSEDRRLTVVCFLGIECPLVRLYLPRLSRLANQYRDQGVDFIGINSNRQDSLEEVRELFRSTSPEFPIAKDFENRIADQFQATRTPEVFVIDNRLQVVYRGRIDDQFSPGVNRTAPRQHFLKTAIEQFLARQPVEIDRTEAEGCLIGRVHREHASTTLTFTRDILPVLQRNCIECHRDGNIGPMNLRDYDEVVGWGEMMVEVVNDGRMPPWHATGDHWQLSNARQMTGEDKRSLRDWVNGGMPFGDAADLPAPLEFTAGWRLPQKPDLVFEMRGKPFVVPAEGTIEYQYFVVDPGFETDQWVSAAEVVPGNSSVVHHSIVFIRPPDGTRFRGVGWLGAYVPGQSPPMSHPGFAIRIPAGSKLVFQQHYTANGTEQGDVSRVGLVLADRKDVTHEVYTLVGLDQQFEIQPNESRHRVETVLPWFPSNGLLLSVAPHMHFRGTAFDMHVTRKGNRDQAVEVPRYDFNWQHNYEFADPVPLAAVDRIEFGMEFDNSGRNPFNPDPGQFVTWGDQTWEEMAVTFVTVAEPTTNPGEAQTAETAAPVTEITAQERERLEEKILARTQRAMEKYREHIDRFFGRYDRNSDGQIAKSEMPNSIKHFAFLQFDRDGNGFVTRQEMAAGMGQRDQVRNNREIDP